MKVLFMTCCNMCLVDSQSNNLSIINMIEQMQSPTFPFVNPRFVVALLAERSEEEDEVIEAQLEGKIGDHIVFDVPIKFSFQGRSRSRTIAELQGLIIPFPGTLIIVQKLDGRDMATWSIQIDKIGPQEVNLFTGREGEPPIPDS